MVPVERTDQIWREWSPGVRRNLRPVSDRGLLKKDHEEEAQISSRPAKLGDERRLHPRA